jgi:Uma2 family endonuclease
MSAALKLPDFSELYRQLRCLPERQRGEILAGELVVSPRPVLAHATAGSRMNRELGSFDRPPGGRYPGGWHILPEPELHLKTPDGQQHVLIPDIAGWRRERLPILPRKAWLDLRPDWICEVLSPSTARYDRKLKARIYHQAGVDYRWYTGETPLSQPRF